MATVYLCIGTQKTGTTTLQRFMARNAVALARQGYCYPRMKGLGFGKIYKNRNGHFLAYISRDESRQRNYLEEKEKRERAYGQLAQAAVDYPNIVLFDEIIWYQCRKYENFWQDVIAEFQKIGCEVKVVVYLRRQDQVLQSLWNQRVKRMPCIAKGFDAWIADKGYSYFPVDYYAHLMEISKFVGKENMLVRVFERGQFEGEGNSLLSDYLQTIGVQLTDDFKCSQEEANPALYGNFIELKRVMNGVPGYLEMEDFMWAELMSANIYQAAQNKPGKTDMFSYEDKQAFLRQFEGSNRKVAQEFLGREDGVLFREPVCALPKWKVDDGTMYQDLTTFLVKMFCRYENEVKGLNARIDELEKMLGALAKEQKKLANKKSLASRGYRKIKKFVTKGIL